MSRYGRYPTTSLGLARRARAWRKYQEPYWRKKREEEQAQALQTEKTEDPATGGDK